MRDSWKRLWRAYRWSDVDFSPNGGRSKGTKERSTSTNNHSPMSRWHYFRDSDQHNHRQASMRSFARIKPRRWQCEKSTSTKTTWWLWKVTYAWIRKYFRILCKSIGHIESNEEIRGEDERNTCGREDPTLATTEVSLCDSHDRGVIKYAWIRKYFRILCKSIGHIESNEEIRGEDERNTCGREDPTLATTEVSLCDSHDRGVIKYGFSFNTRSHKKITSPWEKRI
jgi:hypothetical protein